MNETQINNLLDIVNQIQVKHEDISRITGRNFNLFEILKLTKDEVRLHSNIIAHLLNPAGSHGQRTLYLDLFLLVLNEKNKPFQKSIDKSEIRLETKTTKVTVEFHIGKQTEEEGGRVDIICLDRNNNKIIIENKIHAPDQINQILRYRNFDNQATLIYLDLFGDAPSNKSLGNKDISEFNLIILSYEKDITKWLELCLKESYQLPVIRESIYQYLATIRKITNQIEIIEMDNDIINLLTGNSGKIKSAILIEKALKDAKKLLLNKFGENLCISLENKYATKIHVEMSFDFGNKYAGIKIYPENTDEVFLQLSFLKENEEFYLEIYNSGNKLKNKKFTKLEANINYYKDKLNYTCKSLGSIQNVSSAWHGDWVCRYTKLDSYFTIGNGWGDLADKNYNIAETVLEDISPIIDCMLHRNS